MNTQFRIMACIVAALVSGAAGAATASTSGAQGAGGQVNFKGTITDASCNVDADSKGQDVDLGTWDKSYLSAAGTETTKTAFHIKVADCPDSVKQVSVLFDGQKDQQMPELLAVTSGATGVGIKLYEDDQTSKVTLGTASKKQNVVADSQGTGSADLKFYADYMSTGEAITAGQANGVADFNMVYN